MNATDTPGGAVPTPLAEASPASLDELFSRDPFGFGAKGDRALIVAELRRMRAKWAMEEAQGRVSASKPKKAPKAVASSADVDAVFAGLLGEPDEPAGGAA